MKCRHCDAVLHHTFLDLGFAPPSNAYLNLEDLSRPEKTFPLRVKVCDRCWLVQTEDYAQADELFRADYAYYSSTSSSWLAHAQRYCQHITGLLGLHEGSHVVEVASNDGYLLRNFVSAGIPCLGIEPTAGTAQVARNLGIPILGEFFGESLGRELAVQGRSADLIIGNNVYAHVPDINDFTRGLAALLKPEGVVTLEFPHLMRMLEQAQFDTVYHEHFSYLSLTTVSRIFSLAGLRVWDVEELPTHGGSLRVYGCLSGSVRERHPRVARMLSQETEAGLTLLETYSAFQARADRIKDALLLFLLEQKRAGRRVAAYGAAAKGNTLLNYAGVKPDLLPRVCDAASAKQGKYLPGSHIPILPPDSLRLDQPEFVLVLPWNLAQEVRQQLAYLSAQSVRFVTVIPELTIQ
jgi:SAM-dependent methyltransferase